MELTLTFNFMPFKFRYFEGLFCGLSNVYKIFALQRWDFTLIYAPVIGFPGMGDPGDTGRNHNFLQ